MQNILSKIFVGSSNEYAIQNKDVNALYFITDSDTQTKSIYKGEVKLGGNFSIKATTPENPEQGVIYYIENFNSTNYPFIGIYKGDTWIPFVDNSILEAYLKTDLSNLDSTGEQTLKTLIWNETEYLRTDIQELDVTTAQGLNDLNTRLEVIEKLLLNSQDNN